MEVRLRPLVLLIASLAVVAAACSTPESAETSTTSDPDPSSTTVAPSNGDPSSTTTTGQEGTDGGTEAPKPPPDGPPAPDFTMALESGGSFTLSEATEPVYMVFWAEW